VPVQEALEQIEAAQKEGKTPEQLLSLIESLHASFLEGDPEERAAFEEALLTVADGLYLPHLFWMYLAGFLEDREAYRPSLEALLRTFATLPPILSPKKTSDSSSMSISQRKNPFTWSGSGTSLRKKLPPKSWLTSSASRPSPNAIP